MYVGMYLVRDGTGTMHACENLEGGMDYAISPSLSLGIFLLFSYVMPVNPIPEK